MKRILSLICLVTVVLSCANDRPDEYNAEGEGLYHIQLNLKKGKEYTRTNIVKQNNRQEISGKTIQMDQDVSTEMQFRVEEIVDGDYIIRLKYNDIHFMLDNEIPVEDPQQQQKMMNEMNDTFAQALALMEKSNITFRISPEGNISEIKGVNDFRTVMAIYLKGYRHHKEIINHFSIEQVEQSLISFFSYLPGKAVKLNERWTSSISNSAVPGVDFRQNHTLKSVKGGKLTISTDRKANGTNQRFETAINNLKFIGQTTGDGNMVIDRRTGFIQSAKSKTVIEGLIKGDPEKVEKTRASEELYLKVVVENLVE